MVKRRSNNEGTIYQRSNGTWRAQISINGERISYTGDSQKECQEWILKTRNQIDTGLTYAGANTYLQEFIEDNLIGLETQLRPATIRQYKRISESYLFPYLGDVKLVDLKPGQIQRVYNKLIKDGRSPRTVELTHAVLRRFLNDAVKLGILGRNPTAATNPPKPEPKEMKIYDETQVQQFIIAVSEIQPWNLAFFHLAITTGLRLGELLGVKWQDLNWEKSTIRIQRQLRRIPYEGLKFQVPKTKHSKRTIKLGENTLELLRQQQQTFFTKMNVTGDAWNNFDLIFFDDDGTPIPPRRMQKSFKEVIAKANLPKIRFHDLRHTAASLMLNQGIPVLVVSKRLGHAKPSITLDIYGHLIQVYQEEAASLMDEVVTPILVTDSEIAP
jgi:integrase